MTDAIEIKTCTKCGATKAVTEFRTKKLVDGTPVPTAWCRACLNEASRLAMARRASDPEFVEARKVRDNARYARLKDDPEFREKERVRWREYGLRPEVKAQARERVRQWALDNPALVLERAARWRAAHPERVREGQRAYRERYPERRKTSAILNNGRRRWLEYNQGSGRFTAMQAELCRAFWSSRCAYCSATVVVRTRGNSKTGFDHVVPLSLGGGHGPENMVVCCKTCNSRKNNRLLSSTLLELLSAQLKFFLSELPRESSWSVQSAVPFAVRQACFAAEERLRGRGTPVGTEW
jgi:5-methylcytosine-specific restriction endonuclease McrA